MAAIQIPDDLDRSLQQAADRLGCLKEDLAQNAIAQRLAEYENTPPELTNAQIERMRQSIAQLDRGDVVSMEETDAFFTSWIAELKSR